MSRLVISALALWCTMSCADSRTIEPPVAYCPVLSERGFQWKGVVGLPGAARAGACVAVYRGDDRVAIGNAGPTGGFALRFVGGGPRLGADPALEIELDGERFLLADHPSAEATLAYEANSLPLVERPEGTLRFEGELESTEISTPITRAWMFTWDEGVVEAVPGPPLLDTDFVALAPGQWTDQAAIVSEHESGGAGGCWWPGGGGGMAACPDEVRARTGCRTPSEGCMGLRGCAPIDVEERRSAAPLPEQMRSIDVEDTRPGPSDAGPGDGEVM